MIRYFNNRALVTMGLNIFCDGSARNNGRVGAKAGYGVYITLNDAVILRHSSPVPADEPQTNQRAELRALAFVLKYIQDGAHRESVIYTDSQYAINCLKTWCAGWERKGWRKADNKPVLHLDLIKPMWEIWKSVEGYTTMNHVNSHTGGRDFASKGNAEADRLATEAADSVV